MVTGVAATGAPVAGTVYLLDSSSPPATMHVLTASDGSFSFNATGLTAPFLLKTTAGGQNLYSIATDFGITNVTPLTTMAVQQAAGGSNLDTLYANRVTADITAAAAKMPNAVAAIQTALAPLMNQYSVGSMNFLNAPFSANHTGIDAMLDGISVAIANGNVSITSKQTNSVIFTAACGNIAGGSFVTTPPPSGNDPSTPPPSGSSSTPPSGSSSTPPSGSTPAPSSGNALYAAKCAGCHGDIANSNLKGTTVAGIQSAISTISMMSMFSGMTVADMQAISDALAGSSSSSGSTPTPAPPVQSPPTTGGTPDGAALYADN
ncbi:MAG TPA: hypothetical protein VIH45_11875, partial [Desulfuromonadaceae bacterium]